MAQTALDTAGMPAGVIDGFDVRKLLDEMAALRRERDAAVALAEHRGWLLENADNKLHTAGQAKRLAEAGWAKAEARVAEVGRKLREAQDDVRYLGLHVRGDGGLIDGLRDLISGMRTALAAYTASHVGHDGDGALVPCTCEHCERARPHLNADASQVWLATTPIATVDTPATAADSAT